MTHELEYQIPDMVQLISAGDPRRVEACNFFLEHGEREKRFANLYYRHFPEEIPGYATLDEIEFAFYVHDMLKGASVSDLTVYEKPVEREPPYSEDTLEIIAHAPLGEQFFMDLEWAGQPVPRVVHEVLGGHHGKLNSQGMATLTGNELGPVARLSGIIDQIVSRCENRERRYGRKPLTFRQAIAEVRENRDKVSVDMRTREVIQGELRYDSRILDNVWEIFKNNPHIDEVGFAWLK